MRMTMVVLTALFLLAAPGGAAPPSTAPSLIELNVNTGFGEAIEFFQIFPDGNFSTTPFELPKGKSLVVTDVVMTPNDPSRVGLYIVSLNARGGPESRLRLLLDTEKQLTLHLSLATGIVFTQPPEAFGFVTNPHSASVRLLGYVQ